MKKLLRRIKNKLEKWDEHFMQLQEDEVMGCNKAKTTGYFWEDPLCASGMELLWK